MNTVHLLGRLGKDVETRTFENGTVKANLSIATSEKYTNKQGEKVEETQWHNVEAFGKQAEILAQYLKKGDQVQITGQLRYREYEGKWYTSIRCNSFSFVGGGQQSQQASKEDFKVPVKEEKTQDDLPF